MKRPSKGVRVVRMGQQKAFKTTYMNEDAGVRMGHHQSIQVVKSHLFKHHDGPICQDVLHREHHHGLFAYTRHLDAQIDWKKKPRFRTVKMLHNCRAIKSYLGLPL
jgi:hypothetical protein